MIFLPWVGVPIAVIALIVKVPGSRRWLAGLIGATVLFGLLLWADDSRKAQRNAEEEARASAVAAQAAQAARLQVLGLATKLRVTDAQCPGAAQFGFCVFQARVENASASAVSAIGVKVELLDCVAGGARLHTEKALQAALRGERDKTEAKDYCQTIGEATSGSIQAWIPAGQARGFVANLTFGAVPPVHGELRWRFWVDPTTVRKAE